MTQRCMVEKCISNANEARTGDGRCGLCAYLAACIVCGATGGLHTPKCHTQRKPMTPDEVLEMNRLILNEYYAIPGDPAKHVDWDAMPFREHLYIEIPVYEQFIGKTWEDANG